MAEHDFYRLMELEPYSGIEVVKKRYRELARMYHPDKNPGNPHAEEYFKVVTQGYNILSDPEDKQKYDQLLRNYYSNKSDLSQKQVRKEDEIREKVRRHREIKRKQFTDAYEKNEMVFPHRYRFILALLMYAGGVLMCYNHWFINYLNFKVFYIVIGAFLFGLGSYLMAENSYMQKSYRKAQRFETFGEEPGPVKTFVLLFVLTPVLFMLMVNLTKQLHLAKFSDTTIATKVLKMERQVSYQYNVEGEEISRVTEAIPGVDYSDRKNLRVRYSRLNPYISELVILDTAWLYRFE